MSVLSHLTAATGARRTTTTMMVGIAVGLLGALALALISGHMSPLLGLVGIIAVIILGAMCASPSFTYLLVTFVIPLERLGRFTDDFDAYAISLSRIIGLAAIIILGIHILVRRWRIRSGIAVYLYAGYTLIAVIGTAWALEPVDARRDALRILANLLFFLFMINSVRSFSLARLGIAVWLVATILTCFYTLYDYYSPTRMQVEEAEMGSTTTRLSSVVNDDSESRTLGIKVRRAYGPTAHPTLYGLNLTMTIPFWFFFIKKERRPWIVRMLLACLLLVCFNIFLSNTRAVILLAIGTFGYCFLTRLVTVNLRTIALAALMATVVLPMVPRDVYMRTLDPSLYSTTKADSIRVRFKMLEKSLELLQRYWLQGIGVGNQTIIVEMITDEVTGRITPDGRKASAHNEFVWTMVETGILGWLFHFGFVAVVTWSSFKAASYFRRWKETEEQYWLMIACQCVMVGILFFGLQTEVFHLTLKGWWFAAALSVALLEMARRMAQERIPSEVERPSAR